ncbi:MAG: hypothetical protein LBO64_10465 [Desulfovibrio sp.]|jgi:hypothetical protein|nr:hypothetical protein [Desulfovibrio sp.]
MKLNAQKTIPENIALPKPRPEKSGAKKAILLASLAVLIVGGAIFWLTRDESTRAQWQGKATDAVDSLVKNTPLADAGNLLRPAPPPPPSFGASSPGSLAGRDVQGTVSAPVDTSRAGGQGIAPVAGVAPGGQPPPETPQITADNAVRPDFVEDLAAYLVANYKPGQRDGALAISVQSVNQRYGVKMPGLMDSPQSGRAGLLRYVFNPSMIQGLYTLYVDRFMEALGRQAAAKPLTPAQTQQLHMAVAGRCVVLAGALEGIAAVSDLKKRLGELQQISQSVVDINSQMMTVVFELDQLREDKAAQSRIDATQTRLNGISDRYRQALENRSAAQRALIAAIRKGGGQSLDEDSLLFLAHWVDRRLRQEPQSIASVQASVGILRDLARRCAQTGTQPQPASAQR